MDYSFPLIYSRIMDRIFNNKLFRKDRLDSEFFTSKCISRLLTKYNIPNYLSDENIQYILVREHYSHVNASIILMYEIEESDIGLINNALSRQLILINGRIDLYDKLEWSEVHNNLLSYAVENKNSWNKMFNHKCEDGTRMFSPNITTLVSFLKYGGKKLDKDIFVDITKTVSLNDECIMYLMNKISNKDIWLKELLSDDNSHIIGTKVNRKYLLSSLSIHTDDINFLLDIDKIVDKWDNDTINVAIYSTILSGSISKLKFMLQKFNIHDLNNLNITSNCSGMLVDESIYIDSSCNKRWSHILNYAIQSKSIDMVKFIYDKCKYVTNSNLITCLDSTLEILDYISDRFNGLLCEYHLAYFSIIHNTKLDKKYLLDKLVTRRQIKVCADKKDISMYKLFSVHKKIIKCKKMNKIYGELLMYDISVIDDIQLNNEIDLYLYRYENRLHFGKAIKYIMYLCVDYLNDVNFSCSSLSDDDLLFLTKEFIYKYNIIALMYMKRKKLIRYDIEVEQFTYTKIFSFIKNDNNKISSRS